MSTEQSKTAEKTRGAARAKTAVKTIAAAKDPFAHVAATQFKAADDVAAYGKSNIDALIQAGTAFFRGVEEMTKSVVGMTQTQVETGMGVAKALLAAKTLAEFTEVQNSYTKTAFDSAVSDATRLSEIAMRITNEAIEPLNARVTATIETFSKPALAA